MKEKKLAEYTSDLGYTLKEHGAIVVKRAPETVPVGIVEVLATPDKFRALCLCEHEMVFVPLSEMSMTIKKGGSYRVIAYEDIRDAQVELADAGMSRRITIALDDEQLVLNAQHERTSAIRASGVFGTWHAENLPYAVKFIEALGTPALAAVPAAAQASDGQEVRHA